MSAVLAVYEKELRQYFRSPIAYFVISVFLLGTGYFFNYNVFLTEIATMDETLQSMGILLIIVTPVIAMRLFSAEFAEGTFELLTTLPLRPWQLVVGKYLGALTLLMLMIMGSAVDLIPLYAYGNPETPKIISGYLGFFLLGMACLGVGQLFSALTQNQIVAAMVTVSVLLALWFIGNLQSFQAAPGLRQLFRYLSFSEHYGQFLRGLVRTDAVGFYLGVSAITLTLNTVYLEWRR